MSGEKKAKGWRFYGLVGFGAIALLSAGVWALQYAGSGPEKTLSPLVVHNNLQIDLNEPDLFLDSDSLSQLPKDLLTIPFLHDVLSEDFVFYYQNHADRLGIEGSIRRIVYEHDLTLKDKLFSSLLDQPAQAALWHDKQGHLSHYMVLIQRSGLSKLLEPLLFAATSDSQLSKTEISSIKINSETIPVYQLRYNGNNALMFATYQDKMLVFSSTDMLFKDDQQDTEATAIAGDLLSGKKRWQASFGLEERTAGKTPVRQRIVVSARLPTLKPETSVTVKSLLDSLATLPAQNKAQEVLLDVVLDEAKIGVASMLGSRVRVKTWSWFADDKQEIRQGGFAGWLTDGTPLWVTGSGTSKTVLTRYATVLNRVLPVPTQVASGQCVEVELFARYPLKKITAEKSTTAVKPGVLNGRYRVTFTNGNHITFVSHGETTLLSEKSKLKLQSHLDREEYVARVLDREAKSTPPEAAKAMTVAIRTFLQQNANREGDCLTIPDSSATQRVSASPATTGARTMTAWTQDLIYAGDPVHYHGSRATEGTLSWRQATAQAGQGERYDQILAFAYPDNSLSRWGAPRSTCQLLPKAKAWLAKKMPQWRRILQGETGYNEPDVFAVCRLVSGFPYTDRQQKRLFIRNFFTLQDRLDLTHEYLHLAFDGYPTGLDENYIETLTRQLLMD
ncbi:TPA: DUF2138 family protein [Escherichia coli]|nr:DUF2138 family protein [Escherichia coli]